MAGMVSQNPRYTQPNAGVPASGTQVGQTNTPTQNAYAAYGSAAKTQGNDYSNIMSKYNDLYNREGSMGTQNLTATATIPTYQTSSDYKGAISNLSDLSKTGGYSAADIDNMRARGVSPIRSVYANAQQDLQRQKALQGGYSPNLTAVTAKMAREMGSELSDATTNVNAGIAQDAHNKFNLDTAGMQNQFSLANLENRFKSLSLPFELQGNALGGMTSLYGTTPATTALMQSGAQNQAQLEQNANQQDTNNKLRVLSAVGGL
jgi:hypothetical protein